MYIFFMRSMVVYVDHVEKRRFAAAVVAYCVLKKKYRKIKKRSCWVKNWIAQRNQLGDYRQFLVELGRQDSDCFRNFHRMCADDFEFLIEKIRPKLEKQDTVMRPAISVAERLALTLRFLASGESYHSLMYLFRIAVSTISTIIPESCQAIYDVLKEDYLKMPSSHAEWYEVAKGFQEKWNFPNCLGALDGKHVVLQAPANSGSHYFNYKGSHSVVLMAVVDANYKFLYIDVGCNGRVSDGGIFTNCSLSKATEENLVQIPPPRSLEGRTKRVPFVLIADDAFAIKSHIMKPYPYRNQPGPNRVFNYRLSRARRVVENAFGHIANRFRILRRPIELCPQKTTTIVLAICAIHNFLLSRNCNHYAPPSCFDQERDGIGENGNWRLDGMPSETLLPLQPPQTRNYTEICKEIRAEFTEYFCSPTGEVPWQYKYI